MVQCYHWSAITWNLTKKINSSSPPNQLFLLTSLFILMGWIFSSLLFTAFCSFKPFPRVYILFLPYWSFLLPLPCFKLIFLSFFLHLFYTFPPIRHPPPLQNSLPILQSTTISFKAAKDFKLGSFFSSFLKSYSYGHLCPLHCAFCAVFLPLLLV